MGDREQRSLSTFHHYFGKFLGSSWLCEFTEISPLKDCGIRARTPGPGSLPDPHPCVQSDLVTSQGVLKASQA